MDSILERIPLTLREALSGISGVTSLMGWLFLLLPQLYENYANQHADGISLAFLGLWVAGDIANLAGALWGGLLPTVIALGIYFCFVDVILVTQTLYYRIRNARRQKAITDGVGNSGGALVGEQSASRRNHDETSPLLQRQASHDSTGDLPYTRRRSSTGPKPLPDIVEQSPAASAKLWAKNVLAILGVCALGAVVWVIAWQIGWWKPQPVEEGPVDDGKSIVGAEILGYISSVLYLGARLPQIWKNWRQKSCDGLSLLFFMLSTLANATYGAQILLHSVEINYFLKNLPWLIGSLGTIAEDVTIFIQFHMYFQKGEERQEAETGDV